MHNTGNPLPSKDILDLYDNSEVVDNFVNSQQDETPDRFGQKRLTLAGLIRRSMALRNEINDFSGALTFRPEWSDVPMNVSEGVGGEGGALNLQAEALGNRSEINKVTSREALRRSYAESGLSIPSGNYIGVCFCVSYQDIPTLPPRFELRVNSTNTQGYTNPTFYNFDRASVDVKNKTVLYFGVVKALAACSSFQTFMYPFGLNPPAGSTCFVSPVAVYDLGSSIPSVVNVGAGVQAFIPDTHVQRVQTAPASGTWPIGYKLHASAPVAGGHEGWICTAAGTPGVWKTFGAISA